MIIWTCEFCNKRYAWNSGCLDTWCDCEGYKEYARKLEAPDWTKAPLIEKEEG